MSEPGSKMPVGVHEADSSTMQDSIKLLCEDRQDDGAKALKIACGCKFSIFSIGPDGRSGVIWRFKLAAETNGAR